MNQRVQEFINQQKIQAEYNMNMEKAKVLNDLGLYDKKYSENPAWSEEYPEYEYDQETKEGRYFKKIPINVTDGEYAEILKYSNIDNTQIESDDVKTNSNTIATIFFCNCSIYFYYRIVFGNCIRRCNRIQIFNWCCFNLLGIRFRWWYAYAWFCRNYQITYCYKK